MQHCGALGYFTLLDDAGFALSIIITEYFQHCTRLLLNISNIEN